MAWVAGVGISDVAVELAREAEAARHAAEAGRHEVVQVAVGRRRELERTEADIIWQQMRVSSQAIATSALAANESVWQQMVDGFRMLKNPAFSRHLLANTIADGTHPGRNSHMERLQSLKNIGYRYPIADE